MLNQDERMLSLGTVLIASALVFSGTATGGQKIVASVPGSDINVGVSGASTTLQFSGVNDPVTGFAITGDFTSPVADQGGGAYPWSTDFAVRVSAPNRPPVASPSPWFGDVSFADFPVADGFGGLGGVSGNGTWTIDFDSGVVAPFVAGLRNVEYHLMAEVPDQTFSYSENTQQGNSWSRPFFITGVSGLGPVDYHLLSFTVDTSGLYSFESLLATGNDHWTCLYIDAFDDTRPLANLHEYGLGNGFSAFDVPRGESSFSQILLEGRTYFWVTSQWSAFAGFSDFTNTIVGPGVVSLAAEGCNDADNAAPFQVLDLADIQGFVSAFLDQTQAADIAPPAGVFDLADIQGFIAAFTAGCP